MVTSSILGCSSRVLLSGLAASALLATPARAEPGVGATMVRIGMSAPLSGPNGVYGNAMRDAIDGYFREVNAAGGVGGRKLELTVLDDGYETDRTVANTRTLIEREKVFALIGYYGSSPTAAAMKVFGDAQVPLVGTVSGADNLRQPANRYMFHVRASYAKETAALVQQLTGSGLRNIAVFYQNDGFGQSGLDGVLQALKAQGLRPVAVATVERNSLDVSAAAEKIAQAEPNAVVMITLVKPTAAFVRELHQRGRYPQLATLSPVGADLLVKELGGEARGIAISQVMPFPWNATSPVVRDYARMMNRQLPNSTVSYYGLEGYVNARVLVEGLRRVGHDLTREKLIDALYAQGGVDLGGYKLAYQPQNHDGSSYIDLTVLGANGQVLH